MYWSLTKYQPSLVILCRLPERERIERGEIVEKMKDRDKEETGTGMKVKKQKHSPVYPYLLQDSMPCPTASQYELDAPVTYDTRHIGHTQRRIKLQDSQLNEIPQYLVRPCVKSPTVARAARDFRYQDNTGTLSPVSLERANNHDRNS